MDDDDDEEGEDVTSEVYALIIQTRSLSSFTFTLIFLSIVYLAIPSSPHVLSLSASALSCAKVNTLGFSYFFRFFFSSHSYSPSSSSLTFTYSFRTPFSVLLPPVPFCLHLLFF